MDNHKLRLRNALKNKLKSNMPTQQKTMKEKEERYEKQKRQIMKKENVIMNNEVVEGWNLLSAPPELPPDGVEIKCNYCNNIIKHDDNVQQQLIDYCRRWHICIKCNNLTQAKLDRNTPDIAGGR